jgi:hypothetical protein
MAIYRNAFFSIGGTDLSAFLRQMNAPQEIEAQDDTVMPDTFRSSAGGLTNWSVDCEFNQGYAAGEPDTVISALLVSPYTSAIVLRPDAGVVASTNPQWAGTALITNYTALQGSVGDQAIATLNMVAASVLTRTTS